MIQAIYQDGYQSPEWATITLESGMAVAVGYAPASKKPWLNLFTRERRKGEKDGFFTGPYRRYGYNLAERRWSYADGPAGATLIKAALHRHFEVEPA